MSLFISGGTPLCGEIAVHGAKNSVLPVLAATILHPGISVIENCPDLSDVHSAISILRHLGCRVQREGTRVTVDATELCCCNIPDSLMREMRSSVIFLGAILARAGCAEMYFPGGCELGNRPIDLHLSALRELGAVIEEEGGRICCNAPSLVAREINLCFPSVGATENIMLAASRAAGVTRIRNAAREPEIEDLARFLRSMGISVHGAGGSVIEVECSQKTKDPMFSVMPDRIVAATYLIGVAMTGGEALVTKLVPEQIAPITSLLRESGCNVTVEKDRIFLKATKTLRPCQTVRTMPYPGFPTDAQAPMMAYATQCDGTSIFVENIFDNRYRHVCELIRLGANIKVEGRVAVVEGKNELHGARVSATDLRGGAALVLAALCAEGESRIDEVCHIDRGYESIESNFSKLGAKIVRREG
ncbi:MAG: UDP-N-acetylglucosamine 1-carboxyvinyltransferase [Oscillospiraceae bacterium]|nr:UDP-N-acetylglucosamine 1-carboxyvinyltransferase [Oscillospiraceae bacterium]